MTKEEYIRYWIESADLDYDTMNTLFENQKYVHALFFAHLYLEKLCKALWVKSNDENIPPKIHNLITLLSKSSVEFDQDQQKLLTILNKYHLDSRYPEEVKMLYQSTTKDVCTYYIQQLNNFKEWLFRNHLST